MSIALDLFCLTVPLMTPCAVLLSVNIGVAGCGWPSSSSVVLSGNACLAFMKRAAILALAADEHTFLIVFAVVAVDPLIMVLALLFRKWIPPALLRASGATRYAASL